MNQKPKKKYTSEVIRVDKDIAAQVRDQLVGKESLGGFYDRAALEKLARDEFPTLQRQTKKP